MIKSKKQIFVIISVFLLVLLGGTYAFFNYSKTGGTQIIAMRYSTPEQYLYMSGCNFLNTKSNSIIRVDRFNTMKIYNGKNNDFGLINTFKSGSTIKTYAEAKNEGIIVETNKNYKGIEKPN